MLFSFLFVSCVTEGEAVDKVSAARSGSAEEDVSAAAEETDGRPDGL